MNAHTAHPRHDRFAGSRGIRSSLALTSVLAVACFATAIVAPTTAAAATVERFQLISHAAGSPSVAANSGSSSSNAISDDGRYVAFDSAATDLITGVTDTNGNDDVFRYDTHTGEVILVTYTATETSTTAAGESHAEAISADGRFVTYASRASDLVAGVTDLNDDFDVFRYDALLGETVLVSHAAGSLTTTGSGQSEAPSISNSGSLIAFQSSATDLVDGVVASRDNVNIYLADLVAGTTTLVTHVATDPKKVPRGDPSNYASRPSLSGDGRFIAYTATYSARALDGDVTESTLWMGNVFRYDVSADRSTALTTGTVDESSYTGQNSLNPSISDDGSVVAYYGGQYFVVTGGFTTSDVFLYDFGTSARTLVSHSTASSTNAANGQSYWPAVSADGRFIVFDSKATNLVDGVTDDNTSYDLFRYERATGAVALLSTRAGSTTVTANGESFPRAGSVSGDGARVVFTTKATNLVSGLTDVNGGDNVDAWGNPVTGNDVYVWDATGVSTAVIAPPQVAPTFSAQPNSVSITAGSTATFTAATSGTPTPAIHWQTSPDGAAWSDVAGATGDTLTIANAGVQLTGTRYRAIAVNVIGSTASAAATLTVTAQDSGPAPSTDENPATNQPAPTVQNPPTVQAPTPAQTTGSVARATPKLAVTAKKNKRGTAAVVAVTVTTGKKAASGKVTITLGKKTIVKQTTLKKGKATLRVPATYLKKLGTTKIIVRYLGSTDVLPLTKKVSLRTVR